MVCTTRAARSGLPGGQDLALEQQLAGQERAVDRTQAQYLRRSHQ